MVTSAWRFGEFQFFLFGDISDKLNGFPNFSGHRGLVGMGEVFQKFDLGLGQIDLSSDHKLYIYTMVYVAVKRFVVGRSSRGRTS